VGESTPRKADVRFLAATHRNLKQRVQEGEFREDFYYRIRVFSIPVPPLRERKEDIPLLCDTFIQKMNRSTGKQIARLSHDVNHSLMEYCWPGNVRELENAIEHAFVTCRADVIELDDLPLEIRSAGHRDMECRERDVALPSPASPRPRLTRDLLLDALENSGWNRSEAARRLGIDRTTVWRKIKQWEIAAPQP
jgi:DNA-binding NtrC family response regulator